MKGALVLMYHAVGVAGEPASRYVVPVRRLRRQLGVLSLLRFHVLPLEELRQRIESGELPSRSVALTFDDGYADNRDLAYPELARRGFPAMLFAVSGPERNDWSTEAPALAGRPLLRPHELRGLGPLLDVGAHTCTHPHLTALTEDAAREEVAGSRRALEQALGRPVTHFAYPHGAFDARVRALVEEAGFVAACTVIPGSNAAGADPLELRRLEIRGTYSLPRFVLTLLFGDTRIRQRWRLPRRASWRRRLRASSTCPASSRCPGS